jgi:hypothetical protein
LGLALLKATTRTLVLVTNFGPETQRRENKFKSLIDKNMISKHVLAARRINVRLWDGALSLWG